MTKATCVPVHRDDIVKVLREIIKPDNLESSNLLSIREELSKRFRKPASYFDGQKEEVNELIVEVLKKMHHEGKLAVSVKSNGVKSTVKGESEEKTITSKRTSTGDALSEPPNTNSESAGEFEKSPKRRKQTQEALEDNREHFQEDEEVVSEEGDDLYEEETGFVVGQDDLEREAAGFAKLGINVDEYDDSLLDDEEYIDDPRARRAAERRIRYEERQRQAEGKGHQQLWRKILKYDEENAEDVIFERIVQRVESRRKQLHRGDADAPDFTMIEGAKAVLQADPSVSRFDEKFQQAIDTLFRYFIHRFKLNEKDTKYYYMELIDKMIQDDSSILKVSVPHLMAFHCENIIPWLEFNPIGVLPVLNDCVNVEAHRERTRLYRTRYCKVALLEWPFSTQLCHLRSRELNTLVKLSGIVVRRGLVLPKLRVLYLKCSLCDSGSDLPIYFTDREKPFHPQKCLFCGSAAFSVDRINTVYDDYQKVTIQEPPQSVLAGRTPRQRTVILSGDLVDTCRPGDLIQILAIYKSRYDVALNIKHNFPVLKTELEAVAVEVETNQSIQEDLTEEDIQHIKKLAKDPCIRERLIASVAPAIFGQKAAKTAICCALFGGVGKGTGANRNEPGSNTTSLLSANPTSSHRIRGDINVLLVGDPGLGKSQFLTYVHKTAPRSVLTTGKGASAVGLTAGLRRDPTTGEWALEGGALVLADLGICCIDEFDKMSNKDRVSIHEAMEQQSISISKAGIVTSLKARCSVIAAANPIFGRYEPSLTFKENVDFSDPILSRFDLIIVMKDVPNTHEDLLLGEYVITNHQLMHPRIENVANYQQVVQTLKNKISSSSACEPLTQKEFANYLRYAKANCRVNLQGSIAPSGRRRYGGGYPLTLRHIESVIRISEANAKMRLSSQLNSSDVDLAIATLLESYISSQRHSVACKLAREYSRYRMLFDGDDHVLVQILRNTIQAQIERNMRRRGAMSLHRKDDDMSLDNNDLDDPEAASVDISLFIQVAKGFKFDPDRVTRWLHSTSFNDSFNIVTRDGRETIVVKSL
ncbi:DNA replication licensing factor MCM2 [Babesia sp. Xinjiang]|uniref:DNA replication licensing factor MCM2 n=1 Tax=Babesia sp. Xinjiang TaxID=462227 RepID=UPI000A24BD09|nr:DNA replication licensing factor MCM2 [Babesia sp. Xinjiang]ORM41744.1 DNA replication licensing factor MCM2 [Babesia sp. Xinjiang]